MVSYDDMNRWMSFGNSVANMFGNANFGDGEQMFNGNSAWGYGADIVKNGYNAIRGKDDKDYSDLEESIIYPAQGAAKGAQFGPWGAAAGALYGLGYSFKDDIGMKDSNFLTQLAFPIDMGDSGGLKVNHKSILKL